MHVLLQNDDTLPTLYQVEDSAYSVKERYSRFLVAKANTLQCVINQHWFNLMNHENHHPELTEKEYRILEKKWNKVLKTHSLEKFIIKNLNGKKLKTEILWH